MKVLLYFEGAKALKKSGIGRALAHQKMALESQKIEYTLDPNDTYDIAHINTVFSKSYKLLKKCKKKNIPVIAHGHSTVEDFKNSFRMYKLIAPFFNRQLKKMYNNADFIITPTLYSQKCIQKIAPNTPITHISNGIKLEQYAKNEKAIDEFKKRFNIKDEKVIINVGFPFVRKGIIDFFEIARKLPDYKFIWFGSLQKIATSRNVLKAIKNKPANVIMPGYVMNEVIKGAFRSSTCLMFTSYEETEGIVVLEGLASECPIIIRNIGVYEDWLTDKKNIFKATTNEEFINTIYYIINNDTSNVTENGYEIVKQRSIENIGLELKEIYSNILTK